MILIFMLNCFDRGIEMTITQQSGKEYFNHKRYDCFKERKV